MCSKNKKLYRVGYIRRKAVAEALYYITSGGAKGISMVSILSYGGSVVYMHRTSIGELNIYLYIPYVYILYIGLCMYI